MKEFKLEAIKLVKETGQTIAKIVIDLCIDGSMLSKCGKVTFPGKGKLAPYDKERFDLIPIPVTRETGR